MNDPDLGLRSEESGTGSEGEAGTGAIPRASAEGLRGPRNSAGGPVAVGPALARCRSALARRLARGGARHGGMLRAVRNPTFPFVYFCRNVAMISAEPLWEKLPPRLRRRLLHAMLRERSALFLDVERSLAGVFGAAARGDSPEPFSDALLDLGAGAECAGVAGDDDAGKSPPPPFGKGGSEAGAVPGGGAVEVAGAVCDSPLSGERGSKAPRTSCQLSDQLPPSVSPGAGESGRAICACVFGKPESSPKISPPCTAGESEVSPGILPPLPKGGGGDFTGGITADSLEISAEIQAGDFHSWSPSAAPSGPPPESPQEADEEGDYCTHCGACCETASGYPDFPEDSLLPARWKRLFASGLGRGHRFCPFFRESAERPGSLCPVHPWRANPCRTFGREDCLFVMEHLLPVLPFSPDGLVPARSGCRILIRSFRSVTGVRQ